MQEILHTERQPCAMASEELKLLDAADPAPMCFGKFTYCVQLFAIEGEAHEVPRAANRVEVRCHRSPDRLLPRTFEGFVEAPR